MRRTTVVSAALALLVPSAASAGAWTKGWTEYYSKLGADFYAPAAYVDPTTGEESEDRFFGQEYSLYLELGLLPVWPIQLSAHVPVKIGTVWFRDPSALGDTLARATTTRMGDLTVGLQGQVLRKGLQLSLGVDVKLPMYRNDGVGAAYGDYAEVFPVPGDGQVDVTGKVLLGGAVPGTPVWMDGAVGYLHRTEAFIGWDVELEFADSLVFAYTLGVGDRLIGMFRLEGNKALFPLSSTGEPVPDRLTKERLALGGAGLFTLWRGLALEVRVMGEVWTNNAPQGVAFGLGLSYRRPNPGPRPRG